MGGEIDGCIVVGYQCFTPRPRMGATAMFIPGAGKMVSIHAPAWGATCCMYRDQVQRVSIHAPHGGGQLPDTLTPANRGFIHAPAWGAKAYQDHIEPICRLNPRPHGGRLFCDDNISLQD